jgi:hypothetical protein
MSRLKSSEILLSGWALKLNMEILSKALLKMPHQIKGEAFFLVTRYSNRDSFVLTAELIAVCVTTLAEDGVS